VVHSALPPPLPPSTIKWGPTPVPPVRLVLPELAPAEVALAPPAPRTTLRELPAALQLAALIPAKPHRTPLANHWMYRPQFSISRVPFHGRAPERRKRLGDGHR
jgi:hypothetical protein